MIDLKDTKNFTFEEEIRGYLDSVERKFVNRESENILSLINKNSDYWSDRRILRRCTDKIDFIKDEVISTVEIIFDGHDFKAYYTSGEPFQSMVVCNFLIDEMISTFQECVFTITNGKKESFVFTYPPSCFDITTHYSTSMRLKIIRAGIWKDTDKASHGLGKMHDGFDVIKHLSFKINGRSK